MSQADNINKAREVMKNGSINFGLVKITYQSENSFRVTIKRPKEEISVDISKNEMIEIANWVLNLFIED